LSILALLHAYFEKVTVLVDGAPQIAAIALYGDDDFIEEPPVAAWTLAFLDTPSVLGSEGAAPLPDGLVGDGDSAFGQEVFDVAQA
jgi:hypothetical protein